jgi:hypothetical protein
MQFLGIDLGKDLDPNWTPMEAISVIKCLDQDGRMQVALRMSDGWTTWEASGLLSLLAVSLKTEFMDSLSTSQDESEEPG